MNSVKASETSYKWILETSAMLDAESQFVRDIKGVKGFNWDYVKLPISYKLDWAICHKDRIQGFAELKIRNCRRNDYPTFLLSMAKYRELLLVNQLFKPTALFVRWKDQDCIHKTQDYDHTQYELRMNGRTDRNRNGDIEPCIHIPVNHFSTIREST